MNVDTAKLRQFINEHFGPEDLRTFLFDYFRPVYYDLTDGLTKSKQIALLLEYCHKHKKFPDLLAAIRRERGFFQPDDFVKNSFIDQKSGKEFVRVPAGEFLFGEDKKKIYLDEFWIAKTPITNADYKRFLDANPQYEVPFVHADWAQPYNWNRQQRTFQADKANHPVVLISWHDAKAYGTWSGTDLPTEQQWEKAARGVDGREYPWGDTWNDNHCNSHEAKIGKTSPVGNFSPEGNSPYGCIDMSGNVWEWTDSLYQDGQDWRVLRGGSWYHNKSIVRTAHRNLNDANSRDYNYGFRVVVYPYLSR